VRLDRPLAQVQVSRELRVALAGGEQPKDLELALVRRSSSPSSFRRTGRRAYSAITRRVIDGASSASPAATTRNRLDEVLGGPFLSRNPLAPARSASKT
jgi:hypothetical protein